MAVVLARVLGPSGYGVYSFTLAVLMLTAIPTQVGIPQLIVRETAQAHANRDWGQMRGLWRWGNIAVSAFSTITLALASFIVYLTNSGDDTSPRIATLTIGLVLVPLIALANLRGACLRGLRKVVQGQLPEGIIRPFLLLLLILIFSEWVYAERTFTPAKAMGLYVLSAIVAFIIGALLLKNAKPAALTQKAVPKYYSREWRNAIIPLAMITGLQLINNYADLLIIGIFRSDEEVGVYRVVFQVTFFVTFGLQAFNQVLQPHFSRLFSNDESQKLQNLLTQSAKIILVLAIIPTAILWLFGAQILSYLFGSAYVSGYTALAILAAGKLTSALFGSVTALLTMAGYERSVWKMYFFTTIANLIMTVILVPKFGIEGAAFSTALTILALNFSLRLMIRNQLGYETIAFRQV